MKKHNNILVDLARTAFLTLCVVELIQLAGYVLGGPQDWKGFFGNIFDLAKATWNLFCMIPVTCIILAIIVIAFIPIYRAFWKKVDEAKGPIILR